MSDNLKLGTHIADIVKRANQRIGMIKRCFTSFTVEKVYTLYKTIIRPLLEYGAPVWSTWQQKDISSLEKVQRRCLKLCPTPWKVED